MSIVFGSAPSAVTSDNGGPVITHPAVELVFWGPAWGGAPGTLSRQIASAYGTIVTSGYLTGLSEYRAGFGPGTIFGQAFISDSTPPASFTNADVHSMLNTELAAAKLPAPTASSSLYYFVIPSSGTSSPGLAGEHTYGSSGGHVFHYGWTVNGSNKIDSLTTIFSHELAEAASDPQGNAIQVNPRNATSWNEVCDGAPANYDYRIDGVLVQSILSARRFHAYMVPTGQQQNFIVSGNGGTLTVNGDQLGGGNDVITVDRSAAGGVSATLNGETALFDSGKIGNIAVNSGGGLDTMNVLATSVPLTLTSASAPTGPDDQVNIGSAGSTLRITARVTTANASGLDAINVDDSAETAGRTLSLVSTPGAAGQGLDGVISGLMPGAVLYPYTQTSSVTIRTGTGPVTAAVKATGVATHLIANGADAVIVGTVASLQTIAGPLSLDDLSPQMTLALDDSADPSPRAIAFDTSMAGAWQDITGLAAAPVRYDAAALDPTQPVVFNAGSGGNTFSINGLAVPAAGPETPVMVKTGAGDDSVTLSAAIPGASLSINGQSGDDTCTVDLSGTTPISGQIAFDGGDGTNSLVLRGAGASNAFTLPAGGQISDGTAQIGYANLANLALEGGTFSVAADLGPISLSTAISGTSLLLDFSQNLGSLEVGAGTTCVLSHSATPGGSALNVGGLVVAGTLDLTDNVLQLRYAAGADPIQDVRSAIASGYDSGAWDGPGIITSEFDSGHGLGFVELPQDPSNASSAGTITVKWARYGDANLDGSVNFSDLLALAQHYNQGSANWNEGDFNYDQNVSFSDLLRLAQNYALSAGAPATFLLAIATPRPK